MHKCKVCGFIYNPEVGDPAAGVTAGTDFNDLPSTWRCPICGVSTDDFEAYEE